MSSTPVQPLPRRADLRRAQAAASRRSSRSTVRRSKDTLAGTSPRRSSLTVSNGARLSVLSVLVVVGIAVTNSMPAVAVTPTAGTMAGGLDSASSQAQTFLAAAAVSDTITRDSFTAEAKPPEPVLVAPVSVQSAETGEGSSEVYSVGTDAGTVAGAWALPVAGRITSPYGPRPDRPVAGVGAYHYGTDLATSCGTPVVAAAAGTVVAATYSGSYGNWILIDHGNGVQTGYAHNQDLLIEEGATVEAGELIALVGSTGASTGCHLHFETQVDGERVNPELFMSKVGVFLG